MKNDLNNISKSVLQEQKDRCEVNLSEMFPNLTDCVWFAGDQETTAAAGPDQELDRVRRDQGQEYVA